MNCQHADVLIQKALDGALSPKERAALDAHLAACPACRTAWDEYRRLARMATAWARRPLTAGDLGEAFTAQVMAQIAARSGQARRPLRALWIGVAAACVLAAALTVVSAVFWPLAFPVAAPAGLLPPPQTAMDAPGWLLSNLRDIPRAAADAWESLAAGYAVPPWARQALWAALVLNGLLLLRAMRPSRRRLT